MFYLSFELFVEELEKEDDAVSAAFGEIGELPWNRIHFDFQMVREDADIHYPDRTVPGDWKFGFEPSFKKSLSGLDAKIRGRILSAISLLMENPIAPKGDTIKPLGDERAGQWRYRIGNYRLIYSADLSAKTVALLAIGPRGSIYES
jgi:mRNA interferase RelE/StbE